MDAPQTRPAPARVAAGLVLALALGAIAGACAGPAPSTPAAGSPTTVPGVPSTASAAPEPTPVLTAVPVGSGAPSVEPSASGSTTTTDWGAILDGVPEGFPVYPDASPVEDLDEPLSGAWMTGAAVDDVATWYRDMLEQLGYTVDDLSSPLEDGSRVMDVRTDLPECRIQLGFRPAGESTIITVLYGAGCAGGGG